MKSSARVSIPLLILLLLAGTGLIPRIFTLDGHVHSFGIVHAEEGQKWTCGMHPMIITDAPGSCPICGMDLVPLKTGTGGAAAETKPAGERKIKYWVAPMDPTYIRDEPGKSPMGMDLVPVYEDEAPAGAVIAIDPVVQQNMSYNFV